MEKLKKGNTFKTDGFINPLGIEPDSRDAADAPSVSIPTGPVPDPIGNAKQTVGSTSMPGLKTR